MSASAPPPGGFCNRCGAALSFGVTFCSRCGMAVAGAVPVAPSFPPPEAHGRSRVALYVGVGILVFLLLVGLIAAAAIPVDQTQSTSATITDPGSATTTYTDDVVMSHGGYFDFSWATADSGTITFTVTSANGASLYSQGAASGTGSVAVNGGGTYIFGVYAWLPESVQFSGTLHYSAPLI